jgi:indoleacetamide hydrolase
MTDSKRRGGAEPDVPPPTTRREFFYWSAALAAAAACRRKESTQPPLPAKTPTASDSLTELSATDALRGLRQGDVSAEDYASALLHRAESEKDLNAFITLDPPRVLESARDADRLRASGGELGPLHGLPIPIKDSVNTGDLPTSGGTPALRDFRPKEDAPVVRSLRAAGAIVMGKTNLHELSWGWTSNNLAYGAVRNPYDPSRIPGGSSGGTAAAVAARMAPLGIAEDTEGSIRVPAAMCGIYGFRPTTGRYPSSGVVPITPLFDQVGPHARTVQDLVLFDSVVAADVGPLPSIALREVRLGVARGYFFERLDPEVERVTNDALRKLQDAGVELVEAEVPGLARFIEEITDPVQIHDIVPMLTKYLKEYGAGISFEELLAGASSDIKADLELNAVPGAPRAISESAYRSATEQALPELRETMRRYFQENRLDALVFPTTMVPALPIGQETDVEIRGEKVSFATAVSRNIAPGSTAGLPGLVVPSGLTGNGLPVSLELDAPSGNDRALLSLGLALENVLGHLPAPRR